MKFKKFNLIFLILLFAQFSVEAKLKKTNLLISEAKSDSLSLKKDSVLFAIGATWKLISNHNQENQNIIESDKCEMYFLTLNKDLTALKSYGLEDVKCKILDVKFTFELLFSEDKPKSKTFLILKNEKDKFRYELVDVNDSNLTIMQISDGPESKLINKQVFELDMPIGMIKSQFEIELKKQKVRDMLKKN